MSVKFEAYLTKCNLKPGKEVTTLQIGLDVIYDDPGDFANGTEVLTALASRIGHQVIVKVADNWVQMNIDDPVREAAREAAREFGETVDRSGLTVEVSTPGREPVQIGSRRRRRSEEGSEEGSEEE